MRKVIWKYSFPIGYEFQLHSIPKNHKVLHVGSQYNVPCMWIEHDAPSDQPERQSLYFMVVGTGDYFDSEGKEHIGTFFDNGYVWHVYEVKK